ncbi:DUF4432 family protein [Micromonospora sp. WMMD882]|uniref:DUF4432 family protein n=1 Tax=Micromonospora sp. WMMD882 TaxID=3015151 RepID=UPI00248C7ED2|nr:DUF4432 family protein [Micromonospora sp. WMMD882]WBB78681.1 DUF4432 family protein [Micromonospora sp. WMMD882]
MDAVPVTDLLTEGLIANLDAVVEIRESTGDPHSGPGGRAYRVALAGGLTFEVLPERGLDLGSLWYRGYPVAWRSPLPAAGPAATPDGPGWNGHFTGGMLATCGLDNIGRARDGHSQHGAHHNTRAVDVAVRRLAPAGVLVSGTVASAAVFGRQVHLRREIESHADRPSLTVRDTIRNEGLTTEPVSLLYHLNFGAPFLAPGARVTTTGARHTPRDDDGTDWRTFPKPVDTVGETVWEHTGYATGPASATVWSPALRAYAEVSWDGDVLPRCFQWIYPSRRGWALAVEPANAPMFGPDRAGPHAGAPLLAPGDTVETGFTLTVREGTP